MSMSVREFLVSLPIADRRRAMSFYQEAFGFDPVGPPTEDGVPEPLMFRLDERTHLALIPTDGLEWVLGDRPVAAPGVTESLLGLTLDTPAAVDRLIERVVHAGGEVVVEAADEEWGYTAICADPDGHAWQVTAATAP